MPHDFERLKVGQAALPDQLGHAGQHEERGMSLVHVENLRFDSQDPHQAQPADGQDVLLVQAMLEAASVQPVRGCAVSRVVLRQIRIEQVEIHAADPDLPCLDEDRAVGRLDGEAELFSVLVENGHQRRPVEAALHVNGFLMPFGGDALQKVAFAVRETEGAERHPHVACRLQIVARQDTQAAGIDAQQMAQPVFHAEIRDIRPGFRDRLSLAPGGQRVEPIQVGAGFRGLLQFQGRQLLEELRRIAAAFFPERRIEHGEQLASFPIPAPPQIARGQRLKLFQLRRQEIEDLDLSRMCGGANPFQHWAQLECVGTEAVVVGRLRAQVCLPGGHPMCTVVFLGEYRPQGLCAQGARRLPEPLPLLSAQLTIFQDLPGQVVT